MTHSYSHFLFLGNGPYLNRGCEAIVRGTMVILRHEFGKEITVDNCSCGSSEILEVQDAKETDPAIHHHSVDPIRFTAQWFLRNLNRRFGTGFSGSFPQLRESLKKACVAMEIGGDNYSLDYGLPIQFMDMDTYVLQRRRPVVLWGASVGPFDNNPEFARIMFNHLHKLSAIFVREPTSLDYLKNHGIHENVFLTADPAFTMAPITVEESRMNFSISPGTIGLNFSPLLIRYIPGGDRTAWITRCQETVLALSRATGRDILLIPHVTSTNPIRDDYRLLVEIEKNTAGKTAGSIQCIGDQFSAAETKWIISQCSVFAGARTHATIAALSSYVPTLSFAYSIKAKGLNQDIFGNQDYCLDIRDFSPEAVTEKIQKIITGSDAIRAHLQTRIPEIRNQALAVGPRLRSLLTAYD